MAFGWRPYVSVAKRRARAQQKINKLRKKRADIHPIEIEGRRITQTFWGNAWCKHIESFSDYDNRLPRGRTYVRNGSVCHLAIKRGNIEAIVSGSELYDIKGTIKPLTSSHWKTIQKTCIGQIGSMLELLQGKLSDNVMNVVTDPQQGLFPQPGEIQLNCNCPDWADLCKHLAAVLYGIGSRLDREPELLFMLRDVDHTTLVRTEIILPPSEGKRRRITGDIGDVFGIDLVQPEDNSTAKLQKKKIKKSIPSSTKTKKKPVFKPTSAAVSRLRKRLRMNRAQFATLLGVSPSTIANWEKKGGKLA